MPERSSSPTDETDHQTNILFSHKTEGIEGKTKEKFNFPPFVFVLCVFQSVYGCVCEFCVL